MNIVSSLYSQPANIGPQDVPRTSPSNVPRASPKGPIWPSRRRPELTSRRRPSWTSWGHLEMTSNGRPNLTPKGLPWEIDSRRPQNVLRTSPSWPWKHVVETMCGHLLDVPKFHFTFLSELIPLIKSIFKQLNTHGAFRTQSNG